jgi:excisionase family DNA binding protein
MVAKAEPLRLLLRPKEAAAALAVCEKTLWTLTKTGRLPCVRAGRAVRYGVDDLRAWIDSNKSTAADIDS